MGKDSINDVEQPVLLLQKRHEPSLETSFLIRYLYAAHFLARWGARMWEFSVGLYMISIWPDSLLLAAIYGVVESASTAVFGPLIGELVDKLSYVKVLRLWLVAQSLSFATAGASVTVLQIFATLRSTNFGAFVLLVILTNISGTIGVLSTLAGTILVEREWVVVISEGHPAESLTDMNSVIRRIDLTSKLLAPVITGFLISFVSLEASAIALAVWNIISVFIEYWLFISVHDGLPALRESSQKRLSRLCPIDSEDSSSVIGENRLKVSIVRAWIVYLKQDVVLPGISLALLYFTVLSFGSLMTASLEWNGIPAYVIGIARGISAAIGIAATIVYPALHSHISTLRTGLWSIWSQWTFLLVCIASIWVENTVLSAYMLMGGVAASRLGLWMFDLAVIQQMQDHVSETDRCVVGGVQNSIQSYMDLLGYVMGIIISHPRDFWKLVTVSFMAVTLAALIYTVHIYRVRKHLVHFEKLLILARYFKTETDGKPTFADL